MTETEPQVPYDVLPETGWPRTVRPLTPDPEVLPVAERVVAEAVERAVTEPTVISPPNSEIPETCTEALAVVLVLPAEPVADVEIDPTLAIDPSPGKAKPPPPELDGGADT
jgi:hypothetical protein